MLVGFTKARLNTWFPESSTKTAMGAPAEMPCATRALVCPAGMVTAPFVLLEPLPPMIWIHDVPSLRHKLLSVVRVK